MPSTTPSSPVVSRDPEVMSGAPVFPGTRVPVQTLIDYLDDGYTIEGFLEQFPTVDKEQAHAYLRAAHDSFAGPLAPTAAELEPLRRSADDYEATESLKQVMAGLRRERPGFFLTGSELEPIFKWKLGSQKARVQHHLAKNTEDDIINATRAAFAATDDAFETEVAMRVASSVLALCEPARYCVFDIRGWRAFYGNSEAAFDVKDYVLYHKRVSGLALELGWSVQETDLAIWCWEKGKR